MYSGGIIGPASVMAVKIGLPDKEQAGAELRGGSRGKSTEGPRSQEDGARSRLCHKAASCGC